MNSQVEDRIENNASINNGDKWRAWVNTMPGSPPILHVVGTVDTTRLDIEFDLERSGEEKKQSSKFNSSFGRTSYLGAQRAW